MIDCAENDFYKATHQTPHSRLVRIVFAKNIIIFHVRPSDIVVTPRPAVKTRFCVFNYGVLYYVFFYAADINRVPRPII